MSRSTNILVVIFAILFVFIIGIVNVLGILGDMSEPPAEWKDYFVLNGTQFFNTYNIIDDAFADKQIGKITLSVPRSADAATYEVREGEAVYLPVGTKLYSVKGYGSESYVAAYDNGDYYLYCVSDSSPKEVLEKCGVKSIRRDVDFHAFPVNTVCRENTEYGVRISVIRKRSEFDDYLSRYVNDFANGSFGFTYNTLTEKRTYDDAYFKKKVLIAVRLPEDDGKIVYDLDSITTDEVKMTLLFKKYSLPDTVTYDNCTVRHLFIEVSAEDYVKQKITYQLERFAVLADGTVKHVSKNDPPTPSDDETENPMHAIVRVLRTKSAALGTQYESVVRTGYGKEFFDENVLVVVSCTDDLHDSDYTFSGMERAGNRLKLKIDRTKRAEGTDPRISFFALPIPLTEYHGELIIPIEAAAEESDIPAERRFEDVLAVGSVSALEDLADKYDIPGDMYDEEFFKEHVLLFAGDLVCSDSIEFKYVSLAAEDGVLRIEIDELIPGECDFCPTYRFVAIPYLRSEFEEKELIANVVPQIDDGEKDGGENKDDALFGIGGYFGIPFH